jgi:hypothetical protein
MIVTFSALNASDTGGGTVEVVAVWQVATLPASTLGREQQQKKATTLPKGKGRFVVVRKPFLPKQVSI